MSNEKLIQFKDTDGNTMFNIPDGGYLRITFTDGIAFRKCWHLEKNGICIGDKPYYLPDLQDSMNQHGIKYEPAIESELETVHGYRITDKTYIGNAVIAMAHNPNAVEPYVTWRGRRDSEYYELGRYFVRAYPAYLNYVERAAEQRARQKSLLAPIVEPIQKRAPFHDRGER